MAKKAPAKKSDSYIAKAPIRRLMKKEGADLIIEKDGISTAIQAKKYSGNVGNTAVHVRVARPVRRN